MTGLAIVGAPRGPAFKPMNPGDLAPDFTALDQNGDEVTLSGLLADGPVVLFFYPKAFTPGCTKESCHFRDLADEFAAIGAHRLGISADDVATQARFDEHYRLGMPLLSDPDRSIAKAYGVKRPGGILNKRQTFVIGADGRIVDVIASEFNMEAHADAALAALR